MIESIIFDILALFTLFGAGLILFRRSPLAVTLGLLLIATASAGLYGLMSAGFLAVMQYVVFVSLVTVLLVFVFMLLNIQREEFGQRRHAINKVLSIVIVSLITVKLVTAIVVLPDTTQLADNFGSLKEVGLLLFSRYLLPFGLVGFIVLTSVISAAVVAGRKA